MRKTIAAIATPPGRGGISIIRISGDNAVKIADAVYRGKKMLCDVPDHSINYGFISENNACIDEVLVSVMLAPHTYTGEDTVEINSHGGISVTRSILNAVIRAGAQPAEPGEFTMRAFLNGKMDLSRAEAVIDIINSDNDVAARNAFGQLRGKLSEEINGIRQRLIDLSAHMQVSIDYPDEDLEDITTIQIQEILNECLCSVDKLISTADNGKIITQGIKAAIVGKPNVGKSSLLNCLSRSNRAIVTDVAGTTRDTLEELVSLDGVPLRLIDTAGIRETSDKVERIGVERSRESISEADIIFVMLDACGIDDDDYSLLSDTADKPRIIIVNKTDISRIDMKIFEGTDAVEISAKNGDGIDALSALIKQKYNLGDLVSSDATMITNVRHKNALIICREALLRAVNVFSSGIPQDVAALDIYQASEALGEITGASVSDDIVSSIFHSFCVGK